MKEILLKLNGMGVSATKEMVEAWLKNNKKGLGTLDDLDIIAMAKSFPAAIERAETKKAIEVAPKSMPLSNSKSVGVAVQLPAFDTAPPESFTEELEAVEQLGQAEGSEDAALLFGAHQRGYSTAFVQGLENHRNFRRELLKRAIAAIGA